MEQRVTPSCGRGGFILITVLVITAVGLLFGAGALLLFKFQCQMRIDRQHEVEKVYSVRSVLNFLRTYTGEVPDDGLAFKYQTGSGRSLKLIACPVVPIFPSTNASHFVIERGDFYLDENDQYLNEYDCEYGALGVTNLHVKGSTGKYPISGVSSNGFYELAFTDVSATNIVEGGVTNNVRWWVNIGMRDTGGWLQEDYGRRYMFWPQSYVDGIDEYKDMMRLAIIRSVSNMNNTVGTRYGWPLSKIGERALVFEIIPHAGNLQSYNNAEMRFSEYVCTGQSQIQIIPKFVYTNTASLARMGIQLASDKVSLFYVGNAKENDQNVDLTSQAYIFSQSVQMSLETYNYFAKEVTVAGAVYPGLHTNEVTGKVYAPDLRAVIEVVASSDRRGEGANIDPNANYDSLTMFKVTPAYQYDVFIEHPDNVVNRATVAQKIGQYVRNGLDYTMLTYDTHGTENKGFRKDEKLAREGKK